MLGQPVRILVAVVAALVLRPGSVRALDLYHGGPKVKLELSTEGAVRTSAPIGPGRPRPPAGNVVQSRHEVRLRLQHVLVNWETRPPALSAFDYLWYQIVLSPSYDGIADYGPSTLRASRHRDDRQLQLFDHHNLRHDMFPSEAFVEGTPERFKLVTFKVGRQTLNWGNAIGLRILEPTNLTDLRLGHPLASSSDQSLRLWIADFKVSLDQWLESFSDLHDWSVESFVMPGPIDSETTRIPSLASPVGPNLPRPEDFGVGLEFFEPRRTWRWSRAGAMLHGSIDKLDLRLVHYRTVSQLPVMRLRVEPLAPDPAPPCNLAGDTVGQAACLEEAALELHYYRQDVTGVGAVYPIVESRLMGYLDAAIFWKERVALSSDLSSDTIANMIERATIEGAPVRAPFHEHDTLHWLAGLTWIPPLPFTLLNFQFSHTYVTNFPNGTRESTPAPDVSRLLIPSISAGGARRNEIVLTAGGLWNLPSPIQIQLVRFKPAVIYDARGTWAIAPGFETITVHGFSLALKYAHVTSADGTFGLFKGRDVVWLRLKFETERETDYAEGKGLLPPSPSDLDSALPPSLSAIR